MAEWSSRLWTAAIFCTVMAVFQPLSAFGQSYSQSSRAFVQSPQVIGMGDAGVALPRLETIFFYNPAHLSQEASIRPKINLLGIRGSLSNNFFDQLSYFEDELQPAISDGLDTRNNDELRELYDETLSLGRRSTIVNGDVLFPSVVAKVREVGLGAGAFGHTTIQYRFDDAGAGVPVVNFSAMGDLIFVGSASVDSELIGIDGLAAGVSGKIVHRWLTLKNKALDAIGSQEDILLFESSTLGFDIGLLYEANFVPLPGDLTFGVAAYDIVGGGYDYEFSSSMSDNDTPDPGMIAEEEALANALYSVNPSYRLGTAYMLPDAVAGLFKNTGITMDYLWYSNPHLPQEALAGLHLGAQAQLGYAIVRGGLNSGYTTFGAGLHVGPIALDYAFYGTEQGRFPGQLASWNHTVQLAVGL